MIQSGSQIDRYVVESELGRGGMASVFRVRHTTLGSDHALKLIHNLRNASLRDRLLREGKTQARLRHPNIVAVTDVVEFEGQLALVMEYVPGLSLADWLARGRLDLREAVRILRGVIEGVRYAHDSGMVHRDLKPANVLMDTVVRPPVPKVADFGIAMVTEESRLTLSGNTMGTVSYMAPEQFVDAKNVDARADVYALAVMLYEMVTGRHPFEGRDIYTIIEAKRQAHYDPPETLAPGLPASVRQAITRGLAPDPADRIPDCDTLAGLLDGEIDEGEVDRRIRSRRKTARSSSGEETFDTSDAAPLPPARSQATFPSTVGSKPRPVLVVGGLAAVALGLVACAGALLFALKGLPGAPTVTVEEAPPPAAAAPVDPPAAPVVAAPVETAPVEAAPIAPVRTDPLPPKKPKVVVASTGSVRVSGVDRAWVENVADGERPALNAVPPGTYQVWVRWAEGEGDSKARRVTVEAGATRSVQCDAAARVCE